MAQAPRDDNFVPAMLFVGSDGETYPVEGDETTGRIYVDVPGGGSGTVTSVSVVSANGFAGSVATATTTPAITLSTTITGILKGNGTSISAVTIGSGLSFDGTTLSATGGGSGTVTSVAMTVPTGLTVSGSPVTTSGTLAVALDTGYVIPLASTLATYVVGPSSATDNALARFDSTTGKLIQDGTISASDVAAGAVTLSTIGNNDLILQTGNATTGSIAITDGVDGNITVSPDNDGYFVVQNKGTAISSYFWINDPTSASSALFEAGANLVSMQGATAGGSMISFYAVDSVTASIGIEFTDEGANGADLFLTHKTNTPASDDSLGAVSFTGSNSTDVDAYSQYARISGKIVDPTATSEDGKLVFNVITAGTATDELELIGSALYPTSNNGLNLGTSSLAFNNTYTTAIELGHASDTTLARSAAGQVTIEGVQVVTTSNTVTLTKKIIQHTVEPGTDDTFTGETMSGLLAGDTIAQWDLVYLDSTSGRFEFTDADATATAGPVAIYMATAAGTDGNALTVLRQGIVRNDGWTWTGAGKPLYVSTTAGGLTETAPSGTGDVVRVVGYTLSDDCIDFRPSNDWVVIT